MILQKLIGSSPDTPNDAQIVDIFPGSYRLAIAAAQMGYRYVGVQQREDVFEAAHEAILFPQLYSYHIILTIVEAYIYVHHIYRIILTFVHSIMHVSELGSMRLWD